MIASRIYSLAIVISIIFTSPVFATHDPQFPHNFGDSFNQSSVISTRADGGGGINAGSGRLPGLAEFDVTRQSQTNIPGEIIARGSADYGSLKLFVEISGSILDHRGSAISNDWYTVLDPTALPGTEGTMFLDYGFHGNVLVTGSQASDVVTAGLSIEQGIMSNGTGGTLLAFSQRSLGGGGGVSTPNNGLSGVEVPFIYNVPFNITTRLGVQLSSDLVFTTRITPTNEIELTYVEGDIERIQADFENTATLDAIYIPVGASLGTKSNVDYTSIVRFGVPTLVPIPGAVWLFGSGFVALLAARRNRPQGSG